MALQGGHRFAVQFDEVFPAGAYAVSEVEQVRDFDRSTPGKFVQEVDKVTGLPVWQVQVLNDPAARKAQKTVTVKLLAERQPVLPATPDTGLPVTPVEFDEMTVTAYVEERSKRLAFSLRASGVRAPGRGAKPHAANGNGASAAASAGAASGKEPAKDSAKDAAKDAA